MNEMLSSIITFAKEFKTIFKAGLIAGFGFLGIWLIVFFIQKNINQYLQPHMQAILKKFIWYAGILLLSFTVLSELGIDIGALVGAAGIVGIAVGFAARTSIANIISGFFLIVEQPFKIGDEVAVDQIVGRIESIDLLAMRLKTSDGLLVRVPNETLIKLSVVNKTFYKDCRIKIVISIGRDHDVESAIALILSTLNSLPVVKKEPAPKIRFKNVNSWMVELHALCIINSHNVATTRAVVVETLFKALTKAKVDVLIDAQ